MLNIQNDTHFENRKNPFFYECKTQSTILLAFNNSFIFYMCDKYFIPQQLKRVRAKDTYNAKNKKFCISSIHFIKKFNWC